MLGRPRCEVRDARLGEAERAPHVDLEDLAPLDEVDRVERLHHVHPERVVDEDVEAGERVDRAGDERRDLLGLDEVGGHRQRPAAVGLDAGLDLGQVVGVAGRQHDGGALPGQRPGIGLPQPRTDPRHDRDLALEQHLDLSELVSEWPVRLDRSPQPP